MCYYYGQRVTRAEYIRLKQLEKAVANYDFLQVPLLQAFQYPQVAVIKPNGSDIDIVQMEWGFLPGNLKDEDDVTRFRKGYVRPDGSWQTGYDTQNARSENLFINRDGKPSMYRYAAMERRCLLIASDFYEWRHVKKKHKKTGAELKSEEAFPYRIFLPEDEYFYMPAVWNGWVNKITGEYKETVSLITTDTNENILMDQVHNKKHRMPTIQSAEIAYDWLFGDLLEKQILEIAHIQFPWRKMNAYTVDKEFRSAPDPAVRYDYPEEALKPLELPDAA